MIPAQTLAAVISRLPLDLPSVANAAHRKRQNGMFGVRWKGVLREQYPTRSNAERKTKDKAGRSQHGSDRLFRRSFAKSEVTHTTVRVPEPASAPPNGRARLSETHSGLTGHSNRPRARLAFNSDGRWPELKHKNTGPTKIE